MTDKELIDEIEIAADMSEMCSSSCMQDALEKINELLDIYHKVT